jgi:hypothetical protein
MVKMIIEKREGGHLVRYNEEHASECQHLADVLANIIPEYQNEIADFTSTLFKDWSVQRLILSTGEVGEAEGLWRAVAELAFGCITVEENHPIAALLALMSPLILCKVAQMRPNLAQE